MRFDPARSALAVLAGLALLSCTDVTTTPKSRFDPNGTSKRTLTPTAGPVVISQVYGGGGNSGATLKNDFIELFNPGSDPADIGGWSVQYTSAAGTSWQVTPIPANTTIQGGGYYLIQEAAGAGGTTSLPTPDASGGIPMSGTDGKVALVSNTVALSGTCPNGVSTIDLVSYGGGNCFPGDGAAAPTLTNTTADLRNLGGCMYTADASADFTAAAPAPRNSASAPNVCGTPNPAASLAITPGLSDMIVGTSVKLRVTAKDAANAVTTTPVTWSTSDPSIATVSQFGLVSGVAAGVATITATAPNGVAASVVVTLSPAEIVISQVYGGGGNSGAPFKNDYIELFNRSTHAVNVSGWSVQYTSSTSSTWAVTNLTGSIPSGGYYLVQESAGSGNATALPTPDAAGTIAMSATDGKVLVARTTTAQSGSCPSGGVVLDLVPYGSANCSITAPTISNATAASRAHGGCTFTGDPSSDFSSGAPAPRSSATTAHSCVAGPFDRVAISGPSTVIVGTTIKLSAAARDANDLDVANAVITWTSGSPSLASVDAGGLVTGLVSDPNPVTISASATVNGVTKSASVQVQVEDPGIHWIDVSTSATSFPPGFQTQLFATARDKSGGQVIPATFTFEPVDATIADIKTVSNTGIITGVAAPTDGSKPGFKITATPAGGGTSYVFITHPVTIEPGTSAPTSIYAKNDEFGDPTAASTDTPNDFLITRPQYTISYNESRGTPNWVSYELDARQMIPGQDRCNCFTADPKLPTDKQIFTSDYTSGGFDRGHMTRSADRTAANVDNATTFYLTNVVPQQADLNQGVWAQFENTLADSATKGGRAVYIITGPLYSRSHGLSFLKNEGKVAIPDSTWKIAFIGPRTGGNPFTRGSIQTWDDLAGTTVLAVNMPNVAGVRGDPWQKYQTTVHKIEAATGYDFLSLLPAAFQFAVEADDHAPTARFTESGALAEGAPLTFDASTSIDPDLGRADLERPEALSYLWHFSDGASASGKVVTHAFALYGAYTATLTVTDAFGWQSMTTQTMTVANVPPVINPFDGATLLEGETYTASVTFVDPGTDPFTGSVSYGDGSGTHAVSIAGRSFALSHLYGTAGSYTVTATVADGVTAASGTATVSVETASQGITSLGAMVDALASLGANAVRGADKTKTSLGDSDIRQLHGKLDEAQAQLAKGNLRPATNQLDEFIRDLEKDVDDGKVPSTSAATVIAFAQRVIVCINR